jgi:hypothetical protein
VIKTRTGSHKPLRSAINSPIVKPENYDFLVTRRRYELEKEEKCFLCCSVHKMLSNVLNRMTPVITVRLQIGSNSAYTSAKAHSSFSLRILIHTRIEGGLVSAIFDDISYTSLSLFFPSFVRLIDVFNTLLVFSTLLSLL